MSKNEENQKLKFFKPFNLSWNAPYIECIYYIYMCHLDSNPGRE